MIINTGQRTDIPAFYADWFANRLSEGFVCVRNPYDPNQVSRYRLDPEVVAAGIITPNIINNSNGNTYYNLKGQRISRLQKGINIIRTNDGKTQKVFVN